MALRQIRLDSDPILRKVSREVTEINDRILELLDDMVETMDDAEGVGLAAPQVGILRRVIVIDAGDGPIKMINPVITDEAGSEIDVEGCLSVPNRSGTVKRPRELKVTYLDENGIKQTLDLEGFKARIVCHEVDHLDGILYTDKMIEEIDMNELMQGEE